MNALCELNIIFSMIKTLLLDLYGISITYHIKCRTSIVIYGRDYVNKVAYDYHDPYYLLCLIMILRCDQHKDEFILYMCIMSYY